MLNQIQAILLDIEGTTTPVDFVYGVLFPYARMHIPDFLAVHGQMPAVQDDLRQLRHEYDQEGNRDDLPNWAEKFAKDSQIEPMQALPFIEYLMDCDRKSTGLKALQGKVWNRGYCDGSLKSQLFEDVPPALECWRRSGKSIYIYSSGSIQAQQLLFRYSEYGDLTSLLSGYFDTTTGSKKECNSYRIIATTIGVSPEMILFISDSVAELEAAKLAGFNTRLSQRPGNSPQEPGEFTEITTFAAL